MEEVARVLAAYGASLDDMVKMVVFYVDEGDDGLRMVEAIDRCFSGKNRPVLSLVPMDALAFPGMRVEKRATRCARPTASPWRERPRTPPGSGSGPVAASPTASAAAR